jgi:transposase
MEDLDYNILYRWFVGLSLDDAVWDATTFTKNRDRLLDGDIATAFFAEVLAAIAAPPIIPATRSVNANASSSSKPLGG